MKRILLLMMVFSVIGIFSLWDMADAVKTDPNFEQVGLASYYSSRLHGRKTASGEPYHKEKLTAAHRTLALGTKVRVTNLSNKKTVDVKINDRGPFAKRRIIDLSLAAARKLDLEQKGVGKVRVEAVE